MRQTVVGVFERYATARQAAQQLRESGFGDSVYVTDEITAVEGDAVNAGDELRDQGGFVAQVRHFFADLFDGDDDQVSPYAEALRRGGGVVKVEVTEDEADAARAALEAAGAMDIDDRASEGRESGRQESADSMRQQQSAGIGQQSLGDTTNEARSGMATPVTGRSGVHVYPRVAQPPLEGASATEQRVSAPDAGAMSGSDYQSHFDANYAQSGERWQDYEPAYRYGDELRADARYTGRGWDEVEPDLRRDWESRNAGPWEKFKGAIRHAWERLTS